MEVNPSLLTVCVCVRACVCAPSCWVMSESLRPHGLKSTKLLCPWGFSRQEYWSGLPCPPPGDIHNPGIKPRSPVVQACSLPSEPPGKLKNTGVVNLSLLQGIFQPRNRTGVTHIARGFFTNWATLNTSPKIFTLNLLDHKVSLSFLL